MQHFEFTAHNFDNKVIPLSSNLIDVYNLFCRTNCKMIVDENYAGPRGPTGPIGLIHSSNNCNPNENGNSHKTPTTILEEKDIYIGIKFMNTFNNQIIEKLQNIKISTGEKPLPSRYVTEIIFFDKYITSTVKYGRYANEKLLQMTKNIPKEYVLRLAQYIDGETLKYDEDLVTTKLYDGDQNLLETFEKVQSKPTGQVELFIRILVSDVPKILSELRLIKNIVNDFQNSVPWTYETTSSANYKLENDQLIAIK